MPTMDNIYYYKSPPQNYLAEELLIGSILLNPEQINYILINVIAESFYFESHQLIYRSINELSKKENINIITLIHILTSHQILNKIGGIQKIIEIIKQSQLFIPLKKNKLYIEQLIAIINNNHIKRLLVQYGYNVIQLSYINQLNIKQIYSKATKYLNYISEYSEDKSIDSFHELIGEFLSNKNIYNQELNKKTNQLNYGFKDLDLLLNGLSRGDLIVLSGRPSTGKTSFAINIAHYLIKSLKIGTCIFSLEMSKIQILHKLIAVASNIPLQIIKSGQLTNQEWNKIQKISNQLLISQLYINDKSNVSIEYIKNTANLVSKEKNQLQLIIIDYLQLIHINNLNPENRTQELSYITRELKILAKNLNLPIIILSQLNRNIEKRINKKPLLSDLKESGCIAVKTYLQINYLNYINIKSLIYNKDQIAIYSFWGYFTQNNKTKNNKYKNIPKKILFFNQYIFDIFIKRCHHLEITHNHKILKRKKWHRQNLLLSSNNILSNHLTHKNQKIIENNTIQKIITNNYIEVYDIQMHEYTNFICRNIILHNSIEQDADIVMMLSNESDEEVIKSKTRILDIIIAKNRNGPIGSIKLLFTPYNNTFISWSNN